MTGRRTARRALLLAVLTIAVFLLTAFMPKSGGNEAVPAADEDFRAVWVSTVLNLDWPSKPGLPVARLKAEADLILDNARLCGLNAILLQVRPCGDAIYPSSFYPWSTYLSGSQGIAPAGGFDPLRYWIEGAHTRGLELHAWINPYRVSMGLSSAPQHSTAVLANLNPAKKHPEWVVRHTDGRMYLDPGLPQVRQLVISGVEELMRNYDIDGIHFDDYFYPGPSFADASSYRKYGGALPLADYRRASVDSLVQAVGERIRALDPECMFGVSPFGIWQNKNSSALGSATSGNESFSSHFADSRKWVKNGWVDYIAPQLYWHIGYGVADYRVLLDWWNDAVKGTGVRLFVGLAAYRVDGASATSAWRSHLQIDDQMNLNDRTPGVSGEIFFRAGHLFSSQPLFSSVKKHYTGSGGVRIAPEDRIAPPALTVGAGRLTVSSPSGNITTTYSSFYVMGCSDPAKPLTVNGSSVSSRSASGYFGRHVPLSAGVNRITVAQGSSSIVRLVTRTAPAKSAPASVPSPQIVKSSLYPIKDTYMNPSDKVTLRCTAPIGAAVSVTVGGKTYPMTPALSRSPGSDRIYTTGYTCTYTLAPTAQTSVTLTVGRPVYRMMYRGKTYAETAPGTLYSLTKDAPFYAEITAETAKIYPGATSSGGPCGEIPRYMKDYVTRYTGQWIRLSSGVFVHESNVRLYTAKSGFLLSVNSAVYRTGGQYESLSLQTVEGALTRVSFPEGKTMLSVSNVRGVKVFTLPENSMFESVAARYDERSRTAFYTFTPKEGEEVQGWYAEVLPGFGTVVYLKPKPAITDPLKPLSGLMVMIDPGHGGSAAGAMGPSGTACTEKDIALRISLVLRTELERRGADVVLTRCGDRYAELQAGRLDPCRDIRPDLFLSVHCNSMNHNVDCTKVSGIASFFFADTSKRLAEVIYDSVAAELLMNKSGLRRENFTVINNFWCPAVLLETGFLPNPADFELLSSTAGQQKMASAAANAIVKFFTGQR